MVRGRGGGRARGGGLGQGDISSRLRWARWGLGGIRDPGSWRPAPLTALFLVTILSNLRAIRAISSSLPIIALGPAPCSAQQPSPAGPGPQPPRPSAQTPRSAAAHCMMRRGVPAPRTTTPRSSSGAHSFLGKVVLTRPPADDPAHNTLRRGREGGAGKEWEEGGAGHSGRSGVGAGLG